LFPSSRLLSKKAKELFQREAGALYKLYHPQNFEFFEAKLGGEVGCLFWRKITLRVKLTAIVKVSWALE